MTPISSVDGLAEQLTWETQTDWNNAVTVTNTFSEGGVIWLDLGQEGWEDGSLSSLPSYWNDESQGDDRIVNNRAYNGSQSVKSNITAGNVGAPLFSIDVRNGQYESTLSYIYQETVDSTIYAMTPKTSSGDQLFSIGTDNPQPAIDDGDGSENLLSGGDVTPSYDEWRQWEATIDWSTQTYDATWTDLTGSSTTQTVTGRALKTASTYDISNIAYTLGGPGSVWGGDDTDTWNDETTGIYANSGLLTSATKSFGSSVSPDIPATTYSLNGESITLDVIGSPGTASEETVSQVLDGSSSFNLTWSNSHTDFRIEPNFSTSSPGTTPTFSSVTLS